VQVRGSVGGLVWRAFSGNAPDYSPRDL